MSNDSLHLKVLPNSGKVEQLRAEAPSTPRAESFEDSLVTITQSDPNQSELVAKVIETIRSVYDPEIPINIYELGLIYSIDVSASNAVSVKMTLTAPACPVAGTLPLEVEKRINAIPEVSTASVEIVWEPAWSRERMSEAALLELGLI